MKAWWGAAAALILAGSAAAAPHHCEAEAKAQAQRLLAFHFAEGGDSGPVPEAGIADEVTMLAPVRALSGAGKFDVLELTGYIYKAEYRIRLIYAQIPDTCVLMGQEILEAGDPY